MKKALMFAVLGMIAASQAGAQGLYKCMADGKVTYQSMPCAKGGEAIDVPPPPTAAQIKAAQARLQEDMERVKQLSASNRADRERKAREEQEEAAANKRVTKVDCDKMRAHREELYGQRLVDRRGSQLDNLAKTQNEIDKLEAEYTKASCGPLD